METAVKGWAAQSARGRREERDAPIVLIGVFKLLKAAALIAVGLVGILTVPGHLAERLERLIFWMGIEPGHRLMHRAIGELWTLAPRQAHRLAALSLAYAAVFLVEGVGLLLRRRWAEWLTVAVTASFMPIELYELVRKPGPGKVVTLLLNAVVVVYLAWRLRRHR